MEREVEKGKEKRNLAAQGGKVQSCSVGGGVELSPAFLPLPGRGLVLGLELLHGPGWPGTLKDLPVNGSCMLGWKVCTF